MNKITKLLKFGLGNDKLSKSIATFSLPAGWTCPFAKYCLARSHRVTGRLTEGKHCTHRCWAASLECAFPTVRNARWHNFDLLKEARTTEGMANLIQQSLPEINMVRPDLSGDFWSETYFLAWLNVALNNPLIVFYGYTKAVPFIVKYKKYLPPNFRFTISKGGTCDYLIARHHLKFAEVVYSVQEANDKRLEIDHDDSHAYNGKKSFALLIHGMQRPGTPASDAVKTLRKQGLGSYGKGAWLPEPKQTIPMKIVLKNGEIFLPEGKEPYMFIPKTPLSPIGGSKRFLKKDVDKRRVSYKMKAQ